MREIIHLDSSREVRFTLGWQDTVGSMEYGQTDVSFFSIAFPDGSTGTASRDSYMLLYSRLLEDGTLIDYEFNCLTVEDAKTQLKILLTYSSENVQLWFDVLHNTIHKVVNI